MAKKVLEINDFTGGLNCYSDPRDIKENEFAQNWNVNVSQSGITKLGGSLFESIRNLPHDSTNQQFGFGLFATGVDYSLSIIDGEFENGFEEGTFQTAYADADSSEIIRSGDFSSTSDWAETGDFTLANPTTYSHSTGVGSLYQNSGTGSGWAHTPTAATMHELIFTIASVSSPLKVTSVTLKGGDGYLAQEDVVLFATGTKSIDNGTYNILFLSWETFVAADNFQIDVVSSDSCSFSIDTISIKQVEAVHLAASSTHQSYTNHETDDFYNNYCIVVDSGTGLGQTRRITDYTGATRVAKIDSDFGDTNPDASSTYKIFRWVGSNTSNETFGNDASKDYIDKAGSTFPYDNIESYTQNAPNAYFLRTKVSSITDHQSKNLGWITYNPSNSSTDLTEDSTTIGATTLKSGVEHILSFWCRATSRYYGYVSDTAYGERVPFVQLYSDSVTDGTNTGLYLFEDKTGPVFMPGADSTYNYADDIAKQYIDNGDFEDGSDTGGDGGRSATYNPPTGWMAYDGNIDHNNNAITYSTNADSDSFGGEGKTLVMTPGSAFDFGFATGETVKPNCYMYQDLTLEDNQWYELFFAYSSASDGVCFSVVDTFDLTTTGVVAAEDEAANDSEATLTVDTTNATDALVKNKEIYKSDGTFFGVCDTVDSTTQITFAGGLTGAVTNNDVLYTANYITPWTFLPDSGGVTSYLYVGQNTSSEYIKPHKFFVPDNSGTPRVIRIAFAPTKASTVVRFDGISVKKSFPDLLSMASRTKIGDPYGDEMTSWKRYQVKFKIPQEYDNATDWVLRLHAGTWGYQAGATYENASYDDNQTVYFDSIRLEVSEPDNLIFLNDNTSTNSKVMIYSSNSGNWTENELVWSGLKMRPVYDYINGVLKISDANFESGNTGKIFHYLKTRRLNGDKEIQGYRVRSSALSSAPPIKTSVSGYGNEVETTFTAVNYINSYTFASEHQLYGTGSTITNWPRDAISGSLGTVLHYYHSDSHWSAENLVDENGTELTDASYTLLPDTHPVYWAWAGQDGTDNDMGGQVSGANDVIRVEFSFEYTFQSAYRGANDDMLHSTTHPQFTFTIGKMANDIFTSGAPSDANQKLLIQGDSSVVTMTGASVGTAVFYDDNGDEIDITHDATNNIPWAYSQFWPIDTLYTNNYGNDSGRMRRGTKTLKGVVSFSPGQIAITDDMIMRLNIVYPHMGGTNLRECIEFQAWNTVNDWDFARYEKIRFDYINVYFDSTSWTAAVDGMVSSDKDKTKIDFTFSTPTGSTAVGWEERVFLVGCTSVNIFDEESNININDTTIGTTISGSSSTNTSAVTAGQSPTVNVYVGNEVAEDDYRSKIKYYMKDTDSDIWYLQFYVDLINNKIHSTTSNYSSYGVRDVTNKCYKYSIPNSKMLNYNEVDSYESQTLVPQDIPFSQLTCDYKTSVVANNKLYVGNIRQDGKIYPDRMISSVINKYNILPSSNFLDVAINDGDEITALEYYKDKILQFKKKKVFVINISGDYEFLEDTFEEIGVIGSHQVTRTPYGVVWINSKGCFIYDGETLTNLIDNKIPENSDSAFIASNYWYISDSPYQSGSVAYNASTKDIVIKVYLGSSTSTEYSPSNTTGIQVITLPDGYVYNIPTKSWYFTNKAFVPRWRTHTSGNSSNFTTDKNGNIITYVRDTTTSHGHRVNDILKWNSNKANDEAILTQRGITDATAINARPHVFISADYTFGDIAVRKKIYKVYVSYKSMNSSGAAEDSDVVVSFAINGAGQGATPTFTVFSDSSTNYDATTGLTGSTQWQIAELIPSSSINNIYSFQLKFEGNSLTSSVDFKINDISIVYRTKPVK